MDNWKRVSTTDKRLKEAINASGKSQAQLSRETGIDKGSISHYISGRYEPKSKAIGKIASALGVSEMWLWGYDVPMQRDTKTHSKDAINLTAVEEQLLELFRQIPEAEQPVVLDMISAALSALNNRSQS